MRGFRAQVHQLPNRRGRAAFRAGFEIFSEQHQSDDDGRSLEVELALRFRAKTAKQVVAVDIGCTGAHDHQYVHVPGTGAQRIVRTLVKPRPNDELYRRGQSHFHRRVHVE